MNVIAQAETADLTWLWILLLVIGGIGIIVSGLGISGKLPKSNYRASFLPDDPSKEQPSTLHSPNKKYCPQCGTANPPEAGFCVNCGTHFPSTH